MDKEIAASSKARPRDRRLQIAKNAGELFSARGFHSVRMEDIAEASGITARALYRHYENKQALLAHVVLEDQQRMLETLSELTTKPNEKRDLGGSLSALAGPRWKVAGCHCCGSARPVIWAPMTIAACAPRRG